VMVVVGLLFVAVLLVFRVDVPASEEGSEDVAWVAPN